MIEKEIAEKYAQALFDLAIEEDKLKEITQEFSEVIEVVNQTEELNQVLKHPQLSHKQKKEILVEVFEDELSTDLFNFLKLLTDKKRVAYLEEIHKEFEKLVEEKENKLEVAVKSPVKLSTKQQKKLKSKLNSILDKNISLVLEVDPELIGGLVLKIGDKVIDGSIENHLQNLKQNLKRLEVSKLGVKE